MPRLRSIRWLNLAMGLGALLVAGQIFIGFTHPAAVVVFRIGDVLLPLVLLHAVRQSQRDLKRLGLDPILAWPERLSAYAFLIVTLVIIAALVVRPWTDVPGATAVSAIGKALLMGMTLLLRLRTQRRVRSGVVQPAVVITPAAAVTISFAVAIGAGWLLLSLPEAGRGGDPVRTLDALFTSTSATCVTGLIVLDTPAAFSRFGLTVILLLIQAGGLGIMTLGGMFSAAIGQRVSLQQRVLARETIIVRERGRLADTFRNVTYYTLVCEAVAAVLLFARWWALGEAPLRAASLAVFHSVSAFCNAGFSLFPDSLERHVGDIWINLLITALILVGGIGFPVVFDVLRFYRERAQGHRARLALHSRLALMTTGYLLLIGFFGFLVLEWGASLRHLALPDCLQAAWFQSVTPRTAGFNTVPMVALADSTRFLMVILMFIGASPGSTGGGIKTTTLAVLAVLSGAMIHGRAGVHVLDREIPESVRHRAMAIIILFGMSVLIWTFALAIFETSGFLDLLFETVSAFGTVGLSTAGTANLTSVGRVAIILAMYMGRVGPLTIALAVAARRRALQLRYPEEPVMVG